MITIKTKEEIKLLREGGKILSNVLTQVCKMAKPGISTEALENLACELIEKAGGRPAFKNYEVFAGEYYPTALCTSINEEVVHAPAIPGRTLKDGDIIGLDIGMEYPIGEKAKNVKIKNKYSKLGGYYTDMSRTVAIGKIDKKAKKLMDVTKKSLEIAIKLVKPGNTLNDIGSAIQKYVESHGFSVVEDLVGHGVGHKVHEDPQVFNYDFSDMQIEDTVLKAGMVIAIEPMVNMGGYEIETGDDNFSIITKDRSLSAHYEHTIAITEKGHIVITE